MNSKLFTLDGKDLLKGLILAVITAILTGIYQIVQTNAALDWATFKPIATATVLAVISYLIKNLATNSNGQFLQAEAKD